MFLSMPAPFSTRLHLALHLTLGKGDHSRFWTEIRANRHAKSYFSKYYAIAWNETNYPTLLS